jgi:hypothetical protein
MAVLLLAVTTVGTAWCGYQASQWSGIQSDNNRQQAEHQLEANRQFGSAVQAISNDTNIIGLYAQAVQAGDTGLARFYRQSLARPGLLPFLDSWAAQVATGQTPTPLLQNPDYTNALLSGYESEQQQATEDAVAGQQAGKTANAYVMNTILLAVALFFAGVTSSFRYRPARVLLIVLALVTLAFAASRLADLPIA